MPRGRGTACNKHVSLGNMVISRSLLASIASAPDEGVAAHISPLVVLVLCIVAGIGTMMLLPGKREIAFRRIGGGLLAAAGLLFPALIARSGVWHLDAAGVYFWIFSAIAIVAAVRVVTHPRPVYSALYFVLTIFASAGLFILMYAEFMAAALVIIYAGAILITYVFVIMLASSASVPEGKPAVAALGECDAVSREPFIACCVGFALMGVLLFVIFDKSQNLRPAAGEPTVDLSNPETIQGTAQSVGNYLFTNQMVSLELAGVILTVAMVGAIVIARRRVMIGQEDAFEAGAVVSPMLTPQDDSPSSIPVYGSTNPRQKAYPEK